MTFQNIDHTAIMQHGCIDPNPLHIYACKKSPATFYSYIIATFACPIW